MPTGRGNQLTKQVGEFLVAAELARRGWIIGLLSGNTPEFDLVATNTRCKSVPVQVKAIKGGDWQFDMRKFVDITFTGRKQTLGARKRYPRNLICVMTLVGGNPAADRFFVLTMRTLQSRIVANHRAFLAKHGGVRPRNPRSTHCSVSVKQLERYEDDWPAITRAVR